MISVIRVAINYLFNFLEYAILLDVIMSWIMPGKSNRFLDILHIFTEPFVAPVRKLQNKFIPGFILDFSAIGALLLLYILQRIISILLGLF